MSENAKISASLPRALLYMLACAALHPGLRSLLIRDATYDDLQRAGVAFAQLIELATGRQVAIANASATDTDDTLWGNISLRTNEHGGSIVWQPGLIGNFDRSASLRLIIVPNLSELSVMAARACTILVGADVAVLERYGNRRVWQPNLCWITGCASADLGGISTHLLDRFALRIDGLLLTATSLNVTTVLDWLTPSPAERAMPLPEDIVDRMRTAVLRFPSFTPEAGARLGEYIGHSEHYYPRREITLGRLAVAHARLEMADAVNPEHVDIAARMLRWRRVLEADERSRSAVRTAVPTIREPGQLLADADIFGRRSENTLESERTINASRDIARFAPFPLSEDPYVEDYATIEREHGSLRLPYSFTRSVGMARGSVLGVERTVSARDLAVVGTLLEAAKFQPVRRLASGHSARRRLLLSPADLRRNRRALVPDHLLVVVVDFTSIQDCAWENALVPYLHWAYVKRAAVCVVCVGAARAHSELRAEQVFERRVQSPRIESALESEPGMATPLAHGLELALHTLRHQMQHGNGLVRQAVLVVFTDGRGNVSLSESKLGRLPVPGTRQGIVDSLDVARMLSRMRGVQAVVLDPQPAQYSDLPVTLAKTLGAQLVKAPVREDLILAVQTGDKKVK